MAIACPYCSHRIKLRPAHPGQYRPRCPRCAQPFLARVPEEPGAQVEVEAITADTLAAGSREGASAPLPALSVASASTPLPAALGGEEGPPSEGLARNLGRGDVRPLLDMPELSEPGGES